MREPLVSVIVTTFDRPRLLLEALSSIQSQTVDDFECIVVDDAGSIPVELPADKRFRLIRQDQHRGVAASLNSALREARGRYVTFLDDDDIYTDERLALGLEGVAHSDLTICWRANPATGVAGRNRLLGEDAHETILLRSIPLRGQTTVARNIVLPFDENLVTSTDVEWWLRMTGLTGVHTVPKIGLLLRRHSGPRLSKNFPEKVNARAYILQKHSDYFAHRPEVTARFLLRMGRFARQAGDHATARTALWRSFKLRPRPRTALMFLRTVRPSSHRATDAHILAALGAGSDGHERS